LSDSVRKEKDGAVIKKRISSGHQWFFCLMQPNVDQRALNALSIPRLIGHIMTLLFY
jgi:hypothetical protein